jgi:hypothetical protein
MEFGAFLHSYWAYRAGVSVGPKVISRIKRLPPEIHTFAEELTNYYGGVFEEEVTEIAQKQCPQNCQPRAFKWERTSFATKESERRYRKRQGKLMTWVENQFVHFVNAPLLFSMYFCLGY